MTLHDDDDARSLASVGSDFGDARQNPEIKYFKILDIHCRRRTA